MPGGYAIVTRNAANSGVDLHIVDMIKTNGDCACGHGMAKTIERGIESMEAAGVTEWSVARGLNPVRHLGAGPSGQTACRRCNGIRVERCTALQTGKITDR